jgi:hypothetical protein
VEIKEVGSDKIIRDIRPPGDTVRVTVVHAPADMACGDVRQFNITTNLPDMTALDFLSASCSMQGLYPVAEGDKSLRFRSLVDLVTRPAGSGVRVVNLDKRAVSRYPDAMSYAFSDYARRNWFRYAEDDSVTVNADASIDAGDETLAAGKDVVTLPFAPCDTRGEDGTGRLQEEACIPVFVKDPDTGKVEFNGDKLKARIVATARPGGINTPYVATFGDEMRWREMLQHQELLARLLESPRVVKLKIRVSPVDMMEWSEAVPVFYWQGRHWLYVTITAAADGTADVEMVEIGDGDGNG